MTQRVKWWGWGDPVRTFPLKAEFRNELLRRLGLESREPARPTRPPGLPAANPECAVAGRAEDEVRLLHATGRGYADLVRLRSGRLEHAPDAVAFPENADEVRRILRLCADRNWAAVPFGGGTSVVGGVDPDRGGHDGVVTIDLTRLARVREIDRESLTATIEAGMFGPAIEEALSSGGFSLGHFPQSFEFSTLGGWIATRSAGQNSTLHGKIENMVVALRAVTPAGEIVTREVPASATGPELREAIVGSEGTLGIITEAIVRIHEEAETEYRSFLFKDFPSGVAALRSIVQSGLTPSVARLSDEGETELSLKMTGADSKLGYKILKFFKGDLRTHLLLGVEGDPDEIAEAAREAGGAAIGRRPGEHWEETRFDLPYLRDELMDLGLLVETLETAAPWSRLLALHASVKAALAKAIGPSHVSCHVSHAYPDGASLYFTFIADGRGRELELWRTAKKAAGDAILAGGGTISHHHGVGADHVPWIESEKGRLQVEMLRALKRTLDPTGILNPGKLIP